MKKFRQFLEGIAENVLSYDEDYSEEILESGLSRLHRHMQTGDLGIMSAETDSQEAKSRQRQMIRRFRDLGYGPIVSRGRTKEWGSESSVVVPRATLGHMKQVGEKFGQQAIIHYNGKTRKASMHYLSASGAKAGATEELGATHYNKPNDLGVTVLKGAGFSKGDERTPTRSFTFENIVLEALLEPPRGMFNPRWKPYQ